jgi:hypothetical protein
MKDCKAYANCDVTDAKECIGCEYLERYYIRQYRHRQSPWYFRPWITQWFTIGSLILLAVGIIISAIMNPSWNFAIVVIGAIALSGGVCFYLGTECNTREVVGR